MLPAPVATNVTVAELESRLEAVRVQMTKERVDFLILTNQKNIEYLTDYRTLSWSYNSRPFFCFVSLHELILIINKIEKRNIESREREFDVVYYDGYLAEGASQIVSTVSARMASNLCCAAIDYGQDMYGRGSLEVVDGLRQIDNRLTVKSAGDVIWPVRMVKTPFEAELKRKSFEIVNAAFDEVIAQAHLGMTEVEMFRQMQSRIFMNGAERADPIAMVFGRGDFIYSRPPRPVPLEAGQYIWTDFRSTYGGYAADRNRIARAGPPEQWEIEIYSKTRQVTIAIAEGVKAGMTCGDVFGSFERLWADAGLPGVYGLVSRIGHGGGLDVTEPPSISKDSTQIIEPGMILHLEPKLELDGAVFQFEEVIFVRETGIEFLSELSPERVPVVNATEAADRLS